MPSEGALFKREWFTHIVPTAPPHLRWCRGYDLAVSTKTSADYTASFRVALDRQTGDLYIADGFRARIEFPDQRRYIVSRIREERNTEHGIESALPEFHQFRFCTLPISLSYYPKGLGSEGQVDATPEIRPCFRYTDA